VLVAGPSARAVDEALYFHRRLAEKGMPFVAFVVNRVHDDPKADARRAPGGLPPLDAALKARLLETYREQQVLARIEGKAINRLEVDGKERAVRVPEMEQDVHNVQGLAEVAEAIFGAEGTARTRRRGTA
jgi:anion-transporting  ArsA/GET3 family ATPase